MKDQEIIQKLKEILLPYVDKASLLDNVNIETHLIRDLKIDSASIVDVVIDVEEEMDIEVADEDIGKLETIGSCIAILRKNLVLS